MDVIWFIDDLNGFQLDSHSFEALHKMLSWQPTTRFNIVVKRQLSTATPTFVMLLRATIYYGDDSLTTLSSVTPVWRGSLLLHSNNQVTIVTPHQ